MVDGWMFCNSPILRFDLICREWDLLCSATVATQVDQKLTRWFSVRSIFFFYLFLPFLLYFVSCLQNQSYNFLVATTSQRCFLSPFSLCAKRIRCMLSSLSLNLNSKWTLPFLVWFALAGHHDKKGKEKELMVWVVVGCCYCLSSQLHKEQKRKISITQKYNNEGKCKHFSEIFGLF